VAATGEICHVLSLSPALSRKRERVTGYRYAMITFHDFRLDEINRATDFWMLRENFHSIA
jgi:hypothetical protein